MMDRKKLEEAINQVDLAVAHLQAMRWDAAIRTIRGTDWPGVRAAAEAHLQTLPKTKMVDVWRVEYAGLSRQPLVEQFSSRHSADSFAEDRRVFGRACIRVTGPHQQEIPEG